MPPLKPVRLLGSVLQQAGLVSAAQVNLVLKAQHETHQQRIGELLTSHGWINQGTADFFAEEWPQRLQDSPLRPLGYYFRDAHLLSESQIDYILAQQKLTQLRFGTLVVASGWLTITTVRFFLESLYLQEAHRPTPLEDEPPLPFNEPDDWERLRERVLENMLANPYQILQQYEQILSRGSVPFSGENEQIALQESGLVTQKDDELVIAHPLIQQVFNQDWVRRELLAIHPYDKMRLNCLNLSQAGQYPYRILSTILAWTNGQTLLTQKIADLVRSGPFILAGSESAVVDQLVEQQILSQWREGGAAQHLHAMEKGILSNQVCDPIDLLTYYQLIWCQHQADLSHSPEETELVRLGFLAQDDQRAKVANLIYQSVFDQDWIEKQLLSQLSEQSSLSASSDSTRLCEENSEDYMQESTNWTNFLQSMTNRLHTSKHLAKIGAFVLGLIGITTFLGWLLSNHFFLQNEGADPAQDEPLSLTKRPLQGPQALTSNEIQSDIPETQSNLDQKPEVESGPSNSLEQLNTLERLDLSSSMAVSLEKVAKISADHKIPLFLTGTQEQNVVSTLGTPTLRSPGYWPNSYGLLYKDIFPHQTDLGYLFDVDTQRLRQTEVAFSQAAGLETISNTLEGLLKGNISDDIKEPLSLIFQRQMKDYEFQVGNLKGIIQRNEKDRIYIGIWEADFH